MLQFGQSDTSAQLILTLTENVSIATPFYLFVFTHVLTKDTVAFILSPSDDASTYQSRYNQFTINPSVLFNGKEPGEWHYIIYEQASNSNLNPAAAGAMLENGKLMFDRDEEYTPTKYDSATTYKVYNG